MFLHFHSSIDWVSVSCNSLLVSLPVFLQCFLSARHSSVGSSLQPIGLYTSGIHLLLQAIYVHRHVCIHTWYQGLFSNIDAQLQRDYYSMCNIFCLCLISLFPLLMWWMIDLHCSCYHSVMWLDFTSIYVHVYHYRSLNHSILHVYYYLFHSYILNYHLTALLHHELMKVQQLSQYSSSVVTM